jgi:tripartite-type tricarboxylate transporter receptor subunit TctC
MSTAWNALKGILLSLSILTAAGPTMADEVGSYPTRPIHIIVPFSPGGASDFAIRLIQQDLSQALGQSIVIDNRPGAAGNIGMEAAAMAQPDGYTLFFGNVGTVSINPYFYPHLRVKPDRDFIPVSVVSETPGILVASTKFAPNSLKEMLAYVKAHPGTVNYAASGISTLNTLEMEQFARIAGLKMTQVPYKGGAGPAVIDLIAGNVQMMFVTLSSASAYVKDGRLKAYAVTTKQRAALMPEVPSMQELGYPESVSTSWQGLFARAGTPRPIIEKLHAAVEKAMLDPKVAKLMTTAGMLPTWSKTPEDFKTFLLAESEKWAGLVKQLKTEPMAK